jgi:glycosyltransferase involved in cell wall biosynthesis
VVIPTYNRSSQLVDTLRLSFERAAALETEFIVVDDGSTDDTAERVAALAAEMPNLRWTTLPNGGPGQARNVGAAMATKDVILLMGDDIQPVSDGFFHIHSGLHGSHPEGTFAVLGKVMSPRPATFVMEHIQGKNGSEQFAFAHIAPHSYVDCRFFYTCNVSVKRSLVRDWKSDGFSKAFGGARGHAFEDTEFAYRISKKRQGIKIFYAPGSLGTHHHHYTIDSFFARQVTAGAMAQVFIRLHPEASNILGISDYIRALHLPTEPPQARRIAECVSIIESLKSYSCNLELTGNLEELLSAVFGLAYAHGFLQANDQPRANVAAAYEVAINYWEQRLGGLPRELNVSDRT